MSTGLVTLFACGDVMPGRGVDQILPHPGDPELREAYMRDANAYVRLAERANGPIPRPAGFSWPWGDALPVLEEAAPAVRVINLETSVTRSAGFAPGKAVHYRMSPDNLPCVAAARPDVCALANNHVLDFEPRGLAETLGSLAGAGLAAAGAGLDAAQARQPVAVRLPGGGRVLVFPAGPPAAASRRTGPRPPPGPAWTCCPACPPRLLMPSSPGPRPPGSPATSSRCPSTGAPTGDTRCLARRSASPAG